MGTGKNPLSLSPLVYAKKSGVENIYFPHLIASLSLVF